MEKLWIFCRIFSMNLIDESTILSMIDDSSDLFVNLTNILIEPWIPENLWKVNWYNSYISVNPVSKSQLFHPFFSPWHFFPRKKPVGAFRYFLRMAVSQRSFNKETYWRRCMKQALLPGLFRGWNCRFRVVSFWVFSGHPFFGGGSINTEPREVAVWMSRDIMKWMI